MASTSPEARGSRPGALRRGAGRAPLSAASLAGGLAAALLAVAAACASGGRDGEVPERQATVRGPAGAKKPEFTILYFNDLHGHLVPFQREGDSVRVGGAARMATLIGDIRQANQEAGRPTVILEGGDIFQGTPLSSVFRGEPDFKFLNMIGLDAMALGNHEFDFGLEVLEQRIGEADFPVLAANVIRQGSGRLFTDPYVIRDLPNGVRLSILGLVTDETPQTTDPVNVSSLVFQPPLLATARYIDTLEDSSDIIIALTHIGSAADRRLADVFDDIDVIVGGHDQVLIPRPLLEDEVIITQAQEHGLYLGRLDLAVDGDDVELLGDTIYSITPAIPEDPDVAEMVASYTRRLDEQLNRVVGRLATPLAGERHDIRGRLTNFGLLLTELMQETTNADLAVINSGGIRSSIPAGPVTLGEILQALPFDNRIMTVQLSGADVERMLAKSVADARLGDSGGFLQVAGIGYDISAGGLSAIEVAGRPLDPSEAYTVAITDFLYNGGDGYDIFRSAGRNPTDTGKLLMDVLASHIRENSPLEVPASPQPPSAPSS